MAADFVENTVKGREIVVVSHVDVSLGWSQCRQIMRRQCRNMRNEKSQCRNMRSVNVGNEISTALFCTVRSGIGQVSVQQSRWWLLYDVLVMLR